MFGVDTSLISIKGIQAWNKVPEYCDCLTSSLLITHITCEICQIYLDVSQLWLHCLLLGDEMPGASCNDWGSTRVRITRVLLVRSMRPAMDGWSLRNVSLLCGQTFQIILSHKFELNTYHTFKMEFHPSVQTHRGCCGRGATAEVSRLLFSCCPLVRTMSYCCLNLQLTERLIEYYISPTFNV